MTVAGSKTKLPLRAKGGPVSLPIVLLLLSVTVPRAAADDIDIYRSSQAGEMPLVVIALDRNLDAEAGVLELWDTACTNLFDNLLLYQLQPQCRWVWNALAKPILARLTDWNAKELDYLRRSNSLWNRDAINQAEDVLLRILDDKTDVGGIGALAAPMHVSRVEVVQLILYRILHQLVGARVVVMANNDDTCPSLPVYGRSPSTNCSNGAFILLGATPIKTHEQADQVYAKVFARLNYGQGLLESEWIEWDVSNLDASVIERDGAGLSEPDAGGVPEAEQCITFDLSEENDEQLNDATECHVTPPYQGKEVYYELLRYLTGGQIYNARLDADNLVPPRWNRPTWVDKNDDGVYESPLNGPDGCKPITVINVMFSHSREDDDSDQAILADPHLSKDLNNNGGPLTWAELRHSLATDGFTYKGSTYYIESRFLVAGPDGDMLAKLVGLPMDAFTTENVSLITIEALNPYRVPDTSKTYSIGGPQRVFSSTPDGGAKKYYIGLFNPDSQEPWSGNLKKLKLNESGDMRTCWSDAQSSGQVEQTDTGADLPTVTPDNPASSQDSGATIYYQTADGEVAPLNLDDATLKELYCTHSEAKNGCRGAFDHGTTLLEAAKRIAWARGYQTGKDVLSDDQYTKFLGFLSKHLDTVQTSIEASAQCNIIFGDGPDGDILQEDIVDVRCSPSYCKVSAWDRVNGIDDLPAEFDPQDDLDIDDRITAVDCSPVAKAPPTRESRMGDILHSKPLPVDYGGETGVRVFVGTNHGFLHQFKGSNGQAVWRFAPRAVMDHFAVWAGGVDFVKHPYGVDGAPVAWVKDTDGDGVVEPADGDHVYLYFGLRRGGNVYYALNVTKPDTKPELLWTINSQTPGFAALGRTFSMPRIAKVLIDSNQDGVPTVKTVLVFAGGYDPGYDNGRIPYDKDGNPNSGASGNAIFVVDAKDGDLIWKATEGPETNSSKTPSDEVSGFVWTHPKFDDPIPSTVALVDTSGDGYVDRLYVGDLGGRIWRADIGSIHVSEWKAAPIASLGRHAGGSPDDHDDEDRRFFHRPDVVSVGHGKQAFYAIVIGSGDRADPRDTSTTNYLYVIQDKGDLVLGAEPVTGADLANFAKNCTEFDTKSYDSEGGPCTSLLDPGFNNKMAGWKIPLGGSVRDGEKIMSTPTTLGGTVLVSSFTPSVNTQKVCKPPFGASRIYAVNLLTGEPVLQQFKQDGDPYSGYHNGVNFARSTPLDTSGIPGGVNYIGSGRFLASDYSVIDVPVQTMWRTYWRKRGTAD